MDRHPCWSLTYLEDCDAASDDDVVGDVLHDAGGLSGDVAEEVGALVPEDPVETLHHLVQVAVAKALDGPDLQSDYILHESGQPRRPRWSKGQIVVWLI